MAEITSVREIKINEENIKMEFTYIAEYNQNKTYFTNLDFDTAEGESDDAVEYLNEHLNDYLDNNYLDFTKVSIALFKRISILDNLKFIDKYGYFKVNRKEFENSFK